MTDYDLLVRAGRVFCAQSGFDGPGAVAVKGDRIAALGPSVSGSARETLDFPHDLLLPGLVDMHAHPARGGSRYGVDPDLHFLPRGVTTVLSQGDAGARNWAPYRDEVIAGSRTRVRMALNLSAAGESGPNRCFEFLEDVDVQACAALAADEEAIWGIAVVTLPGPCGDLDPRMIMVRALAAGARAGKPLLVGTRMHEDWSLDDQLEQLRSGDVVTYCFNALAENMLVGGKVRDSVWMARERGVLFDVGHGMNSFAWPVVEAAIAAGFYPDTVSTDQYNRHVESRPQHDLPRTISKIIAAGLPEREAFTRATVRPAELLGLAGEVGTLSVGACADLAVLRFNEEALPLRDVTGAERPGGCWEPLMTVRAGAVCADHR